MRFSLSSYLWIVPFLFFFMGYQALRLIFYCKEIQTPNVLGMNISDAIKKLSTDQLNVRILKEKEDSDFPCGTIINQFPEPLRKIRPQQSVFLVITSKPPALMTPNFINMPLEKVEQEAQEKSLKLKKYYIESSYPSDTIIAQMPQPGQPAIKETVEIYVSSGNISMRIFPNLKKKTISQAKQFLKDYGLNIKIDHSNLAKNEDESLPAHNCNNCIVEAQIPESGTLVDIKKNFTVQLIAKLPA